MNDNNEKMILIVNKPKFCHNCNLTIFQYAEDEDKLHWYCLGDYPNDKELDMENIPPVWCPLIPIPQRLVSKDSNETDDVQKRIMDNVYADGWNDCLYTILNYHIDKDIIKYGDIKDE